MAKNITNDHTNARAMNPVAIQPAIGSPMRLPKNSSRTAPHSGQGRNDPHQIEKIAGTHLVAPSVMRWGP